MKNRISEFIKQKHNESKGSCGTYVVQIISEFKIGYSELRPLMKELRDEGMIKFCEGINGTLVKATNKLLTLKT